MKAIVLASAAVVLAAGGNAQAAVRSCWGAAAAPGGSVMTTYVHTDASGAPSSDAYVTWQLQPGRLSDPSINLTANFWPKQAELGVPGSISASVRVVIDAQPKSSHADLVVTLDGGRTWRVPWGYFNSTVAQQLAGQPASGYVMETLAEGREQNADLLQAFASATRMSVIVEGDAGEIFARRTIDLSDRAGREALFDRTRGEALERLASPSCPPEGKLVYGK